MMTAFVSRLWMMSLQASVLILIVLAVRVLLKRYPKGYSYCLWAIVGLRLLCPVWVEVSVDLPDFVKTVDQVGEWITNAEASEENGGNQEVLSRVEEDIPDALQTKGEQQPGEDKNPAQNNAAGAQESSLGHSDLDKAANNEKEWATVRPQILAFVYFAGVIVFSAIYLIQYLILKKRVSTAVLGKGNVWFSEKISTPFVMGVFRPQIYLPYGLDRISGGYILKHERTHIRHHDPVIRMAGILCLCLHWWNPLVWLAVHQMNQDMEMFCDEGFLLGAPLAERKIYANALLSFAVKRSGLWVELAFGESHTEQRVKNILHPKKKNPAIVAVVVITMMLCGCAFLTEVSGGENKPNNDGSADAIVSSEQKDNGNMESQENGADGEDAHSEAQEEVQIFGTWTISDWIRPSGIYALSDVQIQEIIGSRLEYTEDSFRKMPAGTAEAVTGYTVNTITGEKLAEGFKENAEHLGVAGKELQYYEVSWEGGDLLGQFFYQLDEDNALVYYEGVFFKAERAW